MSELRLPPTGDVTDPIADFIAVVVTNPDLVARLVSIEDRRLFLDEVLRAARDAGYTLTAADLEATMAANRRRWIERSLPW